MVGPSGAQRQGHRRRRWIGRTLWLAFGTLWLALGYWHTTKPLAPGMHVRGEWVPTRMDDIAFLRDTTTADAYGQPIIEQQIFDETLRIIDAATHFVVLDFFLFNDHSGADTAVAYRNLSTELVAALVKRRRDVPALQILFITDPINDVYGGQPSTALQALRDAGVDVVVTRLDVLRDSNPAYSAAWRLGVRWWAGDGAGAGWLPNPLDSGPSRVTFRAWARLANFKANHRKVVIADDAAGGLVGLVTSGNPHDASSAHSNVAMRVRGPALRALLDSELDIARFSGWQGKLDSGERSGATAVTPAFVESADVARVQVLTEGAVRDALLEEFARCRTGDEIDVAMFYLAEREVLEALRGAAQRGASVRLILDPNKDAFGRAKSGIPNRPVASELVTASDGAIRVRWYRTHGEQFHVKLVAIRGHGRFWSTLGSANLTRRNIDDYNLEANLAIEAGADSRVAQDVSEWFDVLWRNRAANGVEYTTDFGVYAEAGQVRYWTYRFMEATGLSTF